MAKSSNNILALGVGLNLDPLNNDIMQAAATAKSGMEQVSTAIVGGAGKSGTATKEFGDKVQSMRAQLRQATQDAQQMAEKYGVMSQQAIASAARAGELKDKIGDINTVITAFSADSKFTVVAGALQQAAGAASIVTGAMGLLGTESKATQEMLLKVQSALALTQGLAQIKEMGAAFTALQAVIVGQVIPSITAMGISMNMALGVFGLVAIGITALVINYNSVSDATVRWRNELEQTIKTQALQLQLFKTWKEISTRGLSERQQALAAENDIYEKNKNELIQQLVVVEKEEIASGGRRSFARTLINEAIKDNYRIHNEQLAKINDEFNKKEQKEASKKVLNLKTQYAQIAQIQSQFQGGGQMSLGSITAPTMPTKTGLNEKETMAFKIKQETDKAKEAILNASITLSEAQTKLFDDLKKIKEQGIANVFGTIGQAIGQSFADSMNGVETDMLDALGVAIVKSLGALATQIGTTLIAMSVPLILAQIPLGYAYAAAGTGLIAIGTAAQSMAGRKSTSSKSNSVAQSSFSQGTNMNSNFTSNQGNTIVINGMIKGNDIQLVNGRNDKKFNRNFNFG